MDLVLCYIGINVHLDAAMQLVRIVRTKYMDFNGSSSSRIMLCA